MTVFVVCGAGYVSGKEIMTLALLRGLKENGFDPVCIISSWNNGDFENRLQAAGIRYLKLRIGFISKTLTWSAILMTVIQAYHWPKLLWSFRKIIKKERPHLVIHTNFHHVFLLIPVLRLARNFYWSHEIVTNSSFYKRLFTAFNSRMDLFIGVSEAVSTSLKAIVPGQKVLTITNGLPVPATYSAVYRKTSTIRLGIVGQVTEHKGHEVLIEAIGLARKKIDVPLELVIVGTGLPGYLQSLKEKIKHLELENAVTWRGFLKLPDEIYNGVDVVVVPTNRPDPYPTVIIEAGFRGIPVIASDTGGIPEMVVNGVNGFLFHTGDVDSLVEKIMSMTEVDINAISRSARAFSVNTFSEKLFLQRFITAIKA